MNGHLGVKPLFFFHLYSLVSPFCTSAIYSFRFGTFSFVSFDHMLIISFLDSSVLRLGILIYDSAVYSFC